MKNILLCLWLFGAAAGLQAQCLYVNTCDNNAQICDYTYNDVDFWNGPLWWDNNNQTHNLSEGNSNLSSMATDTCFGATSSVKYLLFLDLDGNDTLETVIKSWDPPAPGTVNFNNINNPNYDGGESRIFDGRAVPANQKYQFALQSLVAGNTLTAILRWNTPVDPGVFAIPQLPHGAHKIQWIFSDDQSNEAVCDQNFVVKDCANPIAVCLNGLSVNIMPTQQVSLWAIDFVQYFEDNTTPTNLIQYSIRKTGTGSGFPEDGNGDPIIAIVFNCSELNTQPVEVWVRDAAGNADYCSTYVIVQDNANNCAGGGGTDAPPSLLCFTGPSVHLGADNTVLVAASTLVHAVIDDTTPIGLIDLAIRKTGSGTGFPVDGLGNPAENVVYDALELGVNLVEVWARDTGGHADFCQTYIIVENNIGNTGSAPTVVCKNGLSVNIMPTGVVQLFATDFLQYAEDDNTPANQIQFAIRKAGTGTAFPVDGFGNPINTVVFSCAEWGPQQIELWAMDLDGNSSYCETTVLIQDNLGFCTETLPVHQKICIRRPCDGAVVANVNIEINGTVDAAPPFSYFINNSGLGVDGCYHFDSTFFPVATQINLAISPSKDDDPLNGVTALDLVKISRHILGLEPLSAYNMIAADANRSNSITTFDIVETRKLIQGIYQELPVNSSWRFVDAAFVFPNPSNPFQSAFPEIKGYADLATDSVYVTEFYALKIGDVDCDATPGAVAPDDRQVKFLTIPDASLRAGETVDIPVSFLESGDWEALQLGLTFDADMLDIAAIVPGTLPDMEVSTFATPFPGALNMVWFATQLSPVEAGERLFTVEIRAKKDLQLSQVMQLAQHTKDKPHGFLTEGYSANDTPVKLELLFRDDAVPGQLDQNRVFQPQPNPTADATAIPVQLTASETVRLEIWDVSGRQVWKQTISLPAGVHLLDIPAIALSKAGVYGWRIQAGETTASGKIIRL